MNDAQTWTLIGTLIAILLAYVTVTATLFLRIIDAKFDHLSQRIDLLAQEVDKLTEEMRQGFIRIEAKLDKHETRISRLEGTPS
jgi:Tfp pilus assembly protein PilN